MYKNERNFLDQLHSETLAANFDPTSYLTNWTVSNISRLRK